MLPRRSQRRSAARPPGLPALLALCACALVGEVDEPDAPPPPLTAIERIEVRPGSCAVASDDAGFAFQGEPFAVHIDIRADAPAPSRMLRLAAGIDGRGVRDRIVTFDGSEVGTFTACVDGFDLHWPQRAALRVELFEASTWLQTLETEFPVVPEGHIDTVVYPRFAHPTRRFGTPLRRGEFLRLEASLYVANGTDEAIELDGVVTGMVHDGTRAQSWAIRLDRPVKVAPRAISEIYDFHLSYPLSSGLGQRLYHDSLSMLVSAIRGSHPSPGTATRSLDWATLPGIAVDVVFIGDFTPEKRTRAAMAVIDGASGYLEGAGVTVNRTLSRHYTAAEIGMSDAAIAAFTRIDDAKDIADLAAFQPAKSIERLTVYVVKDMWTNRGDRGAYRGGYDHPTDPKTPFRSPVLEMPVDLGDGGYHSGFQAFSQIAAQRIAEALGGLAEVDQTACRDINPYLPGNAFNLMSAASGSYSWLLSPCQREKLANLPALYIF
ncbi:MAG: hypothetical protein R3A79_27800 [Nannocystaceae bacterium]